MEEIKKSGLELIEQEIKNVIELEKLEIKRINKLESCCSKLTFENIISF